MLAQRRWRRVKSAVKRRRRSWKEREGDAGEGEGVAWKMVRNAKGVGGLVDGYGREEREG